MIIVPKKMVFIGIQLSSLPWLWTSLTILDIGINPPFISLWYTLTVNGTSPVYIPHPLGEIPGKVDVQVKVVEAGQEYIFPGIGSGQSDDDILAEYGGVAYLYNDVHVKIFIPIEKDDSAGIGRIVTTGKFVDSLAQTYLSFMFYSVHVYHFGIKKKYTDGS